MALRLMVVVLGVLEGHGRHRVDFGTQQPQQVDLALRLCVRHVDDTLVPFTSAHVRKANAGVACGSLYHCSTGLEQTPVLCIFDHEQCCAVLD